jgi:hypothetical protein
MKDPFEGLRHHSRRQPPDISTVMAAGTRRRRRELAWLSAGAVVVVTAIALTSTAVDPGGPESSDRLVGADPTSSAAAAHSPEPTGPPSETPSASPPQINTTGAPQALVALHFATGTSNALYGIEQQGDTGSSPGFFLDRLNPNTLAVERTPLIPGVAGGLTLDATTAYIGVQNSPSVLRYRLKDLTRLISWRDPAGSLRGPLAVTRSGLWVVDTRGLTRLLGDGISGGGSAEKATDRIELTPGYSTPDLLANDFWAVLQDSKGCPTLYQGTGPNGLEGTPTPAYLGYCELGLGTVVATPAGALVTTPTGMQGYISLVTRRADSGTWTSAPGPGGANSIFPSVAGHLLFASTPGALYCLGPDAHTLAKASVATLTSEVQVALADHRYFLIFQEGKLGTPQGPRVEAFTPDPACQS